MRKYAVQFQCRPWSSNGTHLLRSLGHDPLLNKGDFCILSDYKAKVKYKLYLEESDTLVFVLEDEYIENALYAATLQAHRERGWLTLRTKGLSELDFEYFDPEFLEKVGLGAPMRKEVNLFVLSTKGGSRWAITRNLGLIITGLMSVLQTGR
jgi:hypothetical protein